MRIEEVRVFNFEFVVDTIPVRFGIPAKTQQEAIKKLTDMLNKILVQINTA